MLESGVINLNSYPQVLMISTNLKAFLLLHLSAPLIATKVKHYQPITSVVVTLLGINPWIKAAMLANKGAPQNQPYFPMFSPKTLEIIIPVHPEHEEDHKVYFKHKQYSNLTMIPPTYSQAAEVKEFWKKTLLDHLFLDTLRFHRVLSSLV